MKDYIFLRWSQFNHYRYLTDYVPLSNLKFLLIQNQIEQHFILKVKICNVIIKNMHINQSLLITHH